MLGFRESDLVAVALPFGPAWVDVVREALEARTALLPLDPRLPEAERRRLLAQARPTAVLTADGLAREGGAEPDLPPDTLLVMATSGTNGPRKLAVLTRAGVEHAVRASAARLGARDDAPWLCALPLAHMGGLLIVLRAALLGAPVVVQPSFDADAFETARDARYTSLVPTMLARLLAAGADLRRFEAILIGGAALPPSLAARAADAGARCVQTYGLTETCGGVVYDGEPLNGVEVTIGADGEVRLRGAPVMAGYLGDAAATARALTPEGWLRTADAGVLEDGRLRVLGRLDDVIVTGGEKVWPDAVEAVLRTHPAVADVAVVGAPDDEWGRRVVAFVVPADAAAPPSLAELREACAGRLAPYEAPREIVVVDDLPRTASGKVTRRALRAGH